jgi:effector-binding domain-containing protein
MITEPRISARPARHTVGVRAQTPFKGTFAVVDRLLEELRRWVSTHGVADEGPFFLRYHVIDMAGTMHIEVGYVIRTPLDGDERVRPGVLPAGRYAHLTYSRYAMRANKALIGWIDENGVRLDRRDTDAGDAFACRYEAYLTDYRVEPRKSAWEVELAIRVADDES